MKINFANNDEVIALFCFEQIICEFFETKIYCKIQISKNKHKTIWTVKPCEALRINSCHFIYFVLSYQLTILKQRAKQSKIIEVKSTDLNKFSYFVYVYKETVWKLRHGLWKLDMMQREEGGEKKEKGLLSIAQNKRRNKKLLLTQVSLRHTHTYSTKTFHNTHCIHCKVEN